MKYLILGAGPAGLSFANALKQKGETSFLVLEKEISAGGLCRSTEVDGAPLDIGGGHFLDTKRPKVNHFLFDFMPETEWNRFTRDSRIYINGQYIHHPFEANIWELEIEEQIQYLKSIAAAGCNTGQQIPKTFVEWIYWKLGDRIADSYMIPYNQKMFGENLNELGTYWMEKLPNVSFEDTLRSCLEHKAYGEEPGHAVFLYPKQYGYGELWRRMADRINTNIEYGKPATKINFHDTSITTADGNLYRAEKIISTIPWSEFRELSGIPDEIGCLISQLKYSSLSIQYHPDNMDSDAHWIYYPDLSLAYHRILLRHNFCIGSRGYWTETNQSRVVERNEPYTFYNPYAYPLNTVNKPLIMDKLLTWAKTNNIYGLGRWGEHCHYNSDVTVERALTLAEELT